MLRSSLTLMCLCAVLGAVGLVVAAAGQPPHLRISGGSESLHDRRDRQTLSSHCWNPPDFDCLSLARTQVSHAELVRLTEVPQLALLDLEGCPIDDQACEVLACMGALEDLCLVGTWVTDRGIETLCRAPRLKSLDLRGTRVTNAVLSSLASCHELRFVDLRGTRVSSDAVETLQGPDPGLLVLVDRRTPHQARANP